MGLLRDADQTWAEFAAQGSDPATPASGISRLFFKSDGKWHWVDDAGTVHTFSSAADLDAHTGDTSNPHSVTAAQLGAQETSEKGAANGYASLDGDGTVPAAQLPDLSISETFAAADEAAMLALDAQVGDLAIRADEGDARYILAGPDASVLANWVGLAHPTDAVQSVAGKTGTVTLESADLTDRANVAVQDGTLSVDDLVVVKSVSPLVVEGLGRDTYAYFTNVVAEGAAGDGATDDTAVIQAAIDAADAAGGGIVFFPQGDYLVTALDLSGYESVTLLGVSLARSVGSLISFAHADATSVVTADNANGITLQGLTFRATDAAYSGRVLDFRGASDSTHITVESCFFSGAGDSFTALCSGRGYNHRYIDNHFYTCNIAIEGIDTAASNTVQTCTIEGNHFSSVVKTAHITNPGAGWRIVGNSVEPLTSGDAGFIVLDGETMRDIEISGNWCGDAGSSTTAQVQVAGVGILIANNLFTMSATGKAVEAVGDTDGFVYMANRHAGGAGTMIDWGAHTHDRPAVLAYNDNGQTLYAGTIPSGLFSHTTIEPSIETVWIGAGEFESVTGAPFPSASGPTVRWLMDDSATEAIATSRVLPASWSTFNVKLAHANATAAAGDVDYQVTHGAFAVGEDTTANDDVSTNQFTAGSQDVRTDESVFSDLSNTSGQIHSFKVSRRGAGAGDTKAGDDAFYGLVFEKVS